jgi:hypothetical protein
MALDTVKTILLQVPLTARLMHTIIPELLTGVIPSAWAFTRHSLRYIGLSKDDHLTIGKGETLDFRPCPVVRDNKERR